MDRIKSFLAIFTTRSKGRVVRYLKTALAVLILIVATITIPVPGPWSTPIFIAGFAILASEYDSFHDFQTKALKAYGSAVKTVKDKLKINN